MITYHKPERLTLFPCSGDRTTDNRTPGPQKATLDRPSSPRKASVLGRHQLCRHHQLRLGFEARYRGFSQTGLRRRGQDISCLQCLCRSIETCRTEQTVQLAIYMPKITKTGGPHELFALLIARKRTADRANIEHRRFGRP